MRRKILTIPISIDAGLAANVVSQVSRKLNQFPELKKCRGFGIAFSDYGGVPFKATLEPIGGRPLIDPVNYKYVEVNPAVKPDERLLTVDFDIDGSDVVVGIIPNLLTTQVIRGEAIFLLTEN